MSLEDFMHDIFCGEEKISAEPNKYFSDKVKHPYITLTLSELHNIYCNWYDYHSPYSDTPDSDTQFQTETDLHEFLLSTLKHKKGNVYYGEGVSTYMEYSYIL